MPTREPAWGGWTRTGPARSDRGVPGGVDALPVPGSRSRRHHVRGSGESFRKARAPRQDSARHAAEPAVRRVARHARTGIRDPARGLAGFHTDSEYTTTRPSGWMPFPSHLRNRRAASGSPRCAHRTTPCCMTASGKPCLRVRGGRIRGLSHRHRPDTTAMRADIGSRRGVKHAESPIRCVRGIVRRGLARRRGSAFTRSRWPGGRSCAPMTVAKAGCRFAGMPMGRCPGLSDDARSEPARCRDAGSGLVTGGFQHRNPCRRALPRCPGGGHCVPFAFSLACGGNRLSKLRAVQLHTRNG